MVAPTPVEEDVEETITFEDTSEEETAFHGDPTTDPDAPFSKDGQSVDASAESEAAVDFEMVADGDDSNGTDAGGDDGNIEASDYELDELEAEIARELED